MTSRTRWRPAPIRGPDSDSDDIPDRVEGLHDSDGVPDYKERSVREDENLVEVSGRACVGNTRARRGRSRSARVAGRPTLQRPPIEWAPWPLSMASPTLNPVLVATRARRPAFRVTFEIQQSSGGLHLERRST